MCLARTVVLVILTVASLAQNNSMSLKTDLIAYYTFDDSADDGIFHNALGGPNSLIPAAPINRVTGKIGDGYGLPGFETTYADAVDADALRPSWGGSWYIAFWGVGTSSDDHYFLHIAPIGAETGNDGEARIIKIDADIAFQVNGVEEVDVNIFGANDTTWHLIEAWYDADAHKIGIRGDHGTPSEAACAGITPVPDVVFRIGDALFMNEGPELRIDELGIWHRILTETESAQLWNNGEGVNLFQRNPPTEPPIFPPSVLQNVASGFDHIQPGDSIETRRRKLNAGFTLAEYRLNLIQRAVQAAKIVPARGPEGAQGARGGSQGSQGSQGHQGSAGPLGAQGPAGFQGDAGIQGPQGNRGTPGNYGVIGDTGAQGPQGSQGAPGIQGPKGAKGTGGPTGSQGIQGFTGTTGPQGPPGAGTLGYAASSTSFVLMGTGSKTFAVQAGLAYAAGQPVRISVRTSLTSYMEGSVTSYSGTSLVISVDRITAAGTYADWTINLAGLVGLTGAQGPQGVPGGEGPPGDVGVQGPDGAQGSQGTGSSPVGPTGAQGPLGTTGPDGREGRAGRDDHGFGS